MVATLVSSPPSVRLAINLAKLAQEETLTLVLPVPTVDSWKVVSACVLALAVLFLKVPPINVSPVM